MILTSTQDNSEHELISELYKLADAGASVIQVRTREPIRTALVLRKSLLSSADSEYREWDTVNGFRAFSMENYLDHRAPGGKEDFMEAVEEPLRQLRDTASSVVAYPERIHYYAFINPHPFLANNAYATELIQQYAAILPSTNVCLIFITPDISLEGIPAGTLLIADMHTPSAAELEEVLARVVGKAEADFAEGSQLDDDDLRKLSYLGLGMTLYEFETYAAIAIIEAAGRQESGITMDSLAKGISLGKTAVVKQSDILELTPSQNMADVGGMARLKDWVAGRAGCYSDEAKAYGIEPPAGVVLVGVPGTGKSLAAKAIASELGVPLVRFDFARVFSKFVGDSESRVRAALQMVEDMAPICLMIDEVDKALGDSSGGGGDSGTSSRVLGTFLSWLQDKTAPVFVVMTANKVGGLPPELLRRGRFDQIFSVGMPSDVERVEVLTIHMRKRNKHNKFSKDELFEFCKSSKDYVPAEIESAVKDALISAFNRKEPLGMQHVIGALAEMIPMSKSNKAQIDAIVAWAKDNATPVNYEAGQGPNGAIGSPALPTLPVRRMVKRGSSAATGE